MAGTGELDYLDPAFWEAKGRAHVQAAREGKLQFVELPCDVSAWPDTWIAGELLTYDVGTEFEIDIGAVLSAHNPITAKPVGNVDELLERAAATSGDERIAALEAAWRACFAPELADAIEALDAQRPIVTVKEPKKKSELEAAWRAIADTTPPKSLFAGTWPSKWRDAQRRLRSLYQRPRSPLLASAAVAFANRDDVPYTSIASQQFWTSLAWFIAEQGDVRQLAAIETLEKRIGLYVDRSYMPVSTALHQFSAPPLSAKTRDAIAKLATEKPPKPAPALSLASPEERAVAADVLQQAGDPRGEFITVQERIAIAPTPELLKRQKQLLKKHAKTWCPPSIYRDTCVFRGGIPVAGHVICRSDSELRALIGSKSLATFDTLIVDGSFAMGDVTAESIADFARSLPQLRCFMTTQGAAEAIAAGTPTTIEHLVVKVYGRERAGVVHGPGLPKLRALGFEDVKAWQAQWGKQPVAVVLGALAHLHKNSPSEGTAWELWAAQDKKKLIVTAHPQPGCTAASLTSTLATVKSWKGASCLRVPKNFVEAAKATAKKLEVKTIAAVEPAALGTTVDLA